MDTTQETPRQLTGECAPDAAAYLLHAQQRAAALGDRALIFVRELPITCVIGAMAIGFTVGKIAARH